MSASLLSTQSISLILDQDIEIALNKVDSKDAAVALVLEEIERSMRLLEVDSRSVDRKTHREKVKGLLSIAEKIKTTGQWRALSASSGHGRTSGASPAVITKLPVSSRELSKAEQIIILKSSIVNNLKFPPWQKSPVSSDFDCGPDGHLYL